MTQPDEFFPSGGLPYFTANAPPGFAAWSARLEADWRALLDPHMPDLSKWALDDLKACWTDFVTAFTAIDWNLTVLIGDCVELFRACWAFAGCLWRWVLTVIDNFTGIDLLAAGDVFLKDQFDLCNHNFTDTWMGISWGSLNGVWTALCAFVNWGLCIIDWAMAVIKKLFGVELGGLWDAFEWDVLIGCFTAFGDVIAGVDYLSPGSGALMTTIGAVISFLQCLGNWALQVIRNLLSWDIDLLHLGSVAQFIDWIIEFFFGPDVLAAWHAALDWITGIADSTLVPAIQALWGVWKNLIAPLADTLTGITGATLEDVAAWVAGLPGIAQLVAAITGGEGGWEFLTAWFSDLLWLFGPVTGLGTGTVGIPAFANIPLFGAITDFFAGLFGEAGTLLDSAVQRFLDFFHLGNLADLQDWLTDQKAKAETALANFEYMLTHFDLPDIPGLTDLWDQIQAKADEAWTNWQTLLANFELAAITDFNSMVADLQSKAQTAYDNFAALLEGTAQETIAGLASMINGLVGESLGDLLSSLSLADIPALSTYLADAKAAADDAATKFTDLLAGIDSDVDGLISKINGLAENALGDLMALLPGISDISGFATWLTGTRTTAQAAADNFADLLTGTSQTTVDGLIDWMQDAGNIVAGTLAQARIPSLDSSWASLGRTIHGSLLAGNASIPGNLLTGNVAAGIVQGALTNATLAGNAITSAIASANIPSLPSNWGKTIHGALLTGSVAGSLLSGNIAAGLISGVTATEQSIMNSLYQAFHGAGAGNLNTIKTDLQNLFNTLFGQYTPATLLKMGAIPSLTGAWAGSIDGSKLAGTIQANLLGAGIALNKIASGLGNANFGVDLAALNTFNIQIRSFLNYNIVGPINGMLGSLRSALPIVAWPPNLSNF